MTAACAARTYPIRDLGGLTVHAFHSLAAIFPTQKLVGSHIAAVSFAKACVDRVEFSQVYLGDGVRGLIVPEMPKLASHASKFASSRH